MGEELTSKLTGRRIIFFMKDSWEEELIERDVTILQIVPDSHIYLKNNDEFGLEGYMPFVGHLEGIYQIKDFNTQKIIYLNESIIEIYNKRFIENDERQKIMNKGKWDLENIN